MLHPFLFFVGYTRFSVCADSAAAFVELCGELSVSCRSEGFKADKQNGDQRAVFICSAFSTRRIINAAKTRGIDFLSVERCGAPHLIASSFFSAKRAGLTVGLVIAVFMIISSSGVIWDVRINGSERLEDAHILSLLAANGVCVGTPKSKLETSVIENKILMASDEIAWLSINIRGTVATVEIKEALPSPPKNDFEASNLVSNANGTVERFEDIKGNLAVSLGEPVSKGQLLVGGIYDSNAFSGIRYTRARGKIFARCEKDFHIEIPLDYNKKVYTGAKKTKKSLIFFKKEVNFFGNSRNSYTSCDKIITERYFDLFGLGKLPFGIRTETCFEYETERARLEPEVALEQALFTLSQRIIEDSPEYELLRKQTSTEITDTALILDCHVVCLQNVAVEQEIEIDILK